MFYRVSSYCPTIDKKNLQEGIVQYSDRDKRFLISPKWHNDDSNCWIADTPEDERIVLSDNDCLMFGLTLISQIFSNPLPSWLSKYSEIGFNDAKHALSFAAQSYPIANYFLGRLHEQYGKEAAAQEFYKKTQKASEMVCKMVYYYFPQQQNNLWENLKIKNLDDAFVDMERRGLKHALITEQTLVSHLQSLKTINNAKEHLDDFLPTMLALSDFYEKKKNPAEALKWSLMHAVYSNNFSALNRMGYHDLDAQIQQYVLPLLHEKSYEERLNLINIFAYICDIYQYLVSKAKDHSDDANRRRVDFLNLINLSSQEGFKSRADFNGYLQQTKQQNKLSLEDKPLPGVTFFRSQRYNDKREALYKQAENLETFKTVACAFQQYLSDNQKTPYTFPYFLNASKEAWEAQQRRANQQQGKRFRDTSLGGL